jgi:hypothetical protein
MTHRLRRGIAAAGAAAVTAVVLSDIRRVPAQTADPCAAVLTTGSRADSGAQAASSTGFKRGDHDSCGHLDRLWAHRAAVAKKTRIRAQVESPRAENAGNVAVLYDAGDLIIAPNVFDLRGSGLRFTPNAAGGYDVNHQPLAFRATPGAPLVLGDDDSRRSPLPFVFTFYRKPREAVFVNSDGNLTFEDGDSASSPRNVTRLLAGPPRVAAFLADLDSTRGGRIVTSSDRGVFTVTWCAVNGFDSDQTATVQVSLLSDGSIEMQFGEQTTLGDAVVALSPGHTEEFTAVDLSANGLNAGAAAAVGERFAVASEVDTVAVARRFLATHADMFDDLVVFTDRRLRQDAFAVETGVKNDIRGIHIPNFDLSAEHGSAGRLQSIQNMDFLGKYPDDPHVRFRGENSTLSILGQEVGHRWLAFLLFRDHNGEESKALLGRDEAHWSFFFDSDASVVEGNDIEDLGDGSFRTVAAVERYSLLDQYAMGLVDASDMPPSFYVEHPTDGRPPRQSTSAPLVGVTFRGTRRKVRIEEVIAILGPRSPSTAASPHEYHQAFVYVVSAARNADPAAISKIDRIRVAWEQFFSRATDSRMRAITNLLD